MKTQQKMDFNGERKDMRASQLEEGQYPHFVVEKIAIMFYVVEQSLEGHIAQQRV
ncbi:hypothetical protein KSF_022980 [Reticulibacter mediterranei]|uniref:Uncharacterized protein n=1 Tax=Reticulibacter mediterranei TaxID=2778369 RepID=A0A8J3IK41_9CHLR|nr:hypothetical protein [Reticulibacter mediterranei]GHO92250.1 hypothetical protein KSF_022980 [Reticulibacter mediterranei]